MSVSLSFAGQTFVPQPCGALFWPARGTLLLADLHLEKASFFGVHGQFLPPYDSIDTLTCLIDAVEATGATRVIVLGDSFHDGGGAERLPHPARDTLRRLTRDLDWLWITGNHDDASAAVLGGRVAVEAAVDGIVLRHEAVPGDPSPEISGHFHPKLRLTLRGRRVVRRCFALTPAKLVLPAYGVLTGGLDVADPAFLRAVGGPLAALVATPDRLLRFAVAA
jgi:DNA ligase-associated metallophosphoesterase